MKVSAVPVPKMPLSAQTGRARLSPGSSPKRHRYKAVYKGGSKFGKNPGSRGQHIHTICTWAESRECDHLALHQCQLLGFTKVFSRNTSSGGEGTGELSEARGTDERDGRRGPGQAPALQRGTRWPQKHSHPKFRLK